MGQSNQANGSAVFSGNYAYYIIATRARVNVDTVQGSDGGYTSPGDGACLSRVEWFCEARHFQLICAEQFPWKPLTTMFV